MKYNLNIPIAVLFLVQIYMAFAGYFWKQNNMPLLVENTLVLAYFLWYSEYREKMDKKWDSETDQYLRLLRIATAEAKEEGNLKVHEYYELLINDADPKKRSSKQQH